MLLLFSYLPAPKNITSNLPQSMSPSSTESKSYRTSVSSQSDNISVGVSLTSSPALSLRTRASAIITDVSSQDALCSSRLSSFETQNTSTSLSESVNLSYLRAGKTVQWKTVRSWFRPKAGK